MSRPRKDDHIAAALRLLPGVSRRQLTRKLRGLRKGGAAPVTVGAVLPPESPARTATDESYTKALTFIETVQHNTGRRDLAHLKNVAPGARYARLAKPWKGRSGRAAIATGWNAKQHGEREARRAWVLDLERQGRTPAQIRSITRLSERTVRAYLNSR